MPSKYLSPCITYNSGANRLWLPPWMISPLRYRQTVTVHRPARAESALITAVRPNMEGEIEMSFPVAFLSAKTAEAVLAFYDSIIAACEGQKVQINLWSDVGWGACALVEMDASELEVTRRLELVRDLRLSFISETMRPSSDYAIEFDDDDDYEATYPFADYTGRAHGDAVSGTPLVLSAIRQAIAGLFPATISAISTAGNELGFVIGGASGSTWKVSNLQVVGSSKTYATGTTTIRLSTAGVGGSGSNIDLDLVSSATRAVPGEGEFTVEAGATVYAFVTAAGLHSNVQIKFDAELVES
jgi:hypothetical protein